MKITDSTLRKIIREELETIGEERDLESLWTSEVVTDVIGIMQASGLHSGRPSTFLAGILAGKEGAAAVADLMKHYNLSEEDLRAMMAYAKTLYSR